MTGTRTRTVDSRHVTHEHIAQVRGLLLGAAGELMRRAHQHDRSKLCEPERSMFDEYTARLDQLEYGTDAYEEVRQEMLAGPLAHHYEVNDHHPEYFHPERDADREGDPGSGAIGVMNLFQLFELLCDWIAAGRRHQNDGTGRGAAERIYDSIERNRERFGYGDELERILRETVHALLDDELSLGHYGAKRAGD